MVHFMNIHVYKMYICIGTYYIIPIIPSIGGISGHQNIHLAGKNSFFWVSYKNILNFNMKILFSLVLLIPK